MRSIAKKIFMIGYLAIWCSTCFAQNTAEPIANPAPAVTVSETKSATTERAPSPPVGTSSRVNWLSSLEFALSAAVLVFGLILFVAEFLIIKQTSFSPDQSTKLVALTLIIVATLFIITAGFHSEQIAPAMGLFGTVAGYLLGRTQNSGTDDKS